jgi:hypothetical protein
MPELDEPTRVLARIYHYIWLAVVALLVVAGAVYGLGHFVGLSDSGRDTVSAWSVQGYLFLVPFAILIFAVAMTIRRQWMLALTGYVLSAIWIGAKLLG